MLRDLEDHSETDTPPQVTREVEQALKTLQNGKATIEDESVAEMLKNGGNVIADWLLEILQKYRSLVAEHWRLKPEALGSIPGGTTFLSSPLPFQRSTDSNGPNYLYRSSNLGEPHLLGSLCCDKLKILS